MKTYDTGEGQWMRLDEVLCIFVVEDSAAHL